MLELKKKIIKHIVDNFKLSEIDAKGVVEYDNELPEMIAEDNQKNRSHDVPSMAEHLMKNDEGHYQLDLLKS